MMTADLSPTERLAIAPPALAESFIDAVEAREATVAVLGLGYVGLPLAEAFVNAGFPVLGFDVSQAVPLRVKV